MPLTERQKKRLDKLDFGMGGGFSDFMTDRPKLRPSGSRFLFVGLGGKGCDTVAGIKTDVYKRFQHPEGKTHPENFEFLAVDTDLEHLKDLCRGGFGEVGLSNSAADSEICQLFDDQAAQRLRAGRRDIPDYITSWLSPAMNQELQGRGAGGIRQAGRYLLFGEKSFETLQNMLIQKLGKLQHQIHDHDAQKLIVYIFAGVSGGTGSGTIIDVPYIIRQICKNNGWKGVKVYGYIFLPDSYGRAGEGQHLKYNAYAALKEIDTLMNLGHMGRSACFHARYTPFFSVDSDEGIFDTCVLVSGKRNNGMVNRPEEFTRRVVVDNIVNLVAENTDVKDGTFMANSFLDNKFQEISNTVTPLQTPKDAYYQYTVIGAGAIILPMEQILCYIAHGTLERLERGWDKHAQQRDVEELLQQAHMLPEEQASAIIGKSTVGMVEYTKGIGGPAKKQQVQDNSLYNRLQSLWLARNVQMYNAWDVAKNEKLEMIIQSLDSYYRRKFQDKDAGIYFLRELLASRVMDGAQLNGILFRLQKDYMDSIQGLINGQELIRQQAEERMREIQSELDSPLCVGPLAGGKIEEYRRQCIQKFRADSMIDMYRNIVTDCMEQIIRWFEIRLAELQVYIDVFAYMKDIIDDNYVMVMNDTMPMAEYAGKLLEFHKKNNDDATDKAIAYLNGMLDAKSPEGLTTALEGSLLETEKKWIRGEDDFNPMEVFVRFLEKQYDELPELTLEKFLSVKYGAKGVAEGITMICQELRARAEVTFPVSPRLALTSLASHRYMTIPAGSDDMKAAVANFAQTNGANAVNSTDRNGIYWYNLVIGVPLWALSDIGRYERAYEENRVCGMHIQETEADDWKDLPALSNQDNWGGNADFNPRERRFAEQAAADVKNYLACGLVRKKDSGGDYWARCINENDSHYTEEDIVRWCREEYLKEPLRNADGNMECGAAFVDIMVEKNKFNSFQVKMPVVYMDVDDSNIYKLIRMNIFLYRKLQHTYRVYEKCREILLAVDKEKQEEKRVMTQKKRFYDYFRTGIIQVVEKKAVLLERPDGDQEEILFFNDYTEIDNQIYIYYAFGRFDEKYSEETLDELDEQCRVLLDRHDDESQSVYEAASARFMDICAEQRNLLKKLDVKTDFKKVGKEEIVGRAAEFYEGMLALRVGKRK